MHDPKPQRPRKAATEPGPVAWHRVPLVWFAAGLFVCILAACIHLIVLSVRHADTELVHGERVLRVPATAVPDAEPGPARPPP